VHGRLYESPASLGLSQRRRHTKIAGLNHILQHIRNLTKSASIPSTVVYNNTSATHDIDKANLFNKYFYSVFSHSTYSLPNFENMPSTTMSLDSISISEEVYDALSSLDPHKLFVLVEEISK